MVLAEEPAFLTTMNPSPPMKYLYVSIRSAAFYRCANTLHREDPSPPPHLLPPFKFRNPPSSSLLRWSLICAHTRVSNASEANRFSLRMNPACEWVRLILSTNRTCVIFIKGVTGSDALAPLPRVGCLCACPRAHPENALSVMCVGVCFFSPHFVSLFLQNPRIYFGEGRRRCIKYPSWQKCMLNST